MRPAANTTEPAGYAALAEQFAPESIPHHRASYIAKGSGRRSVFVHDREEHTYPSSYRPAAGLGAQLEFALKHDGVNLAILKRVFQHCDQTELTTWIAARPTGRHTRRIWFFFEWLTGERLDLPDVTQGAYVDALDSRYVRAAPVNSRRHRVRDNLLGTRRFCPLVRQTDVMTEMAGKALDRQAKDVIARFPEQTLRRAARFLYLKETKSSFEIERETPSRDRSLRFVELLRASAGIAPLDKAALVSLHAGIVDPRYAETDYRNTQNYVGQTLPGLVEHVHHVSPRPEDVEDLMAGLLECNQRLMDSDVDPVAWAAVVSFGFVFIHPFEDGNGRIHRYLIHDILTRAEFSPTGFTLPVSATMLNRPSDYDKALEALSRQLIERIDFELASTGELTVSGDTADYYRYFDATPMAEYLYRTLELTIDQDFRQELLYLTRYDQARAALQERVDMPDRKLDLFIRLCLGNAGKLSAKKRASQFAELTDDEIDSLQAILSESLDADELGAS